MSFSLYSFNASVSQCHLTSAVVIVLVCNVEKQLDLVTNQDKRRLITTFRFPFKHFANVSIGSNYISFLTVVVSLQYEISGDILPNWVSGNTRKEMYAYLTVLGVSTDTLPKKLIFLRILKYLGQWKRSLCRSCGNNREGKFLLKADEAEHPLIAIAHHVECF